MEPEINRYALSVITVTVLEIVEKLYNMVQLYKLIIVI